MHKIGARIKKWREANDLSVDDLAKNAGVNSQLIASLEEGNVLPTISHLLKISRALDVRLGTFMDDQVTIDPAIHRAGEASNDKDLRDMNQHNPSFSYVSLGKGKNDRNMEPFIIHVKADGTEHFSQHQGEEFLYVLVGQLQFTYGKEHTILAQGDSVYYNSLVPHSVKAMNGDCQILTVVHFPL